MGFSDFEKLRVGVLELILGLPGGRPPLEVQQCQLEIVPIRPHAHFDRRLGEPDAGGHGCLSANAPRIPCGRPLRRLATRKVVLCPDEPT